MMEAEAAWATVSPPSPTQSRYLAILTILGFAIPIALYLWFLDHYSLNVVWLDQWNDVSLIRASYEGHLSLSALWVQHNENRLLFPNLIVLALSRVTAFNITVEEYLGAVLLFAAVALIIFAHRRRSPGRPWIVYCPVVILMLSVVQAGNTLWGFQLAWYLVLVALAAVIYLLDAKTLSAPALLLGMLVAVIGSYSSLQGLFIWVVGLMILFYRKRNSLFFAVWAGAAVLTTAVYFYHYDRSATVAASQTGLHVPGTATRFFFESVGDVLGVPLTQNDVGADLVLAFGVLIVALALWTLWSNGRRRDTESASPVGVALIVFGLLFALGQHLWTRGPWGRRGLRIALHDVRPPDRRRRVSVLSGQGATNQSTEKSDHEPGGVRRPAWWGHRGPGTIRTRQWHPLGEKRTPRLGDHCSGDGGRGSPPRSRRAEPAIYLRFSPGASRGRRSAFNSQIEFLLRRSLGAILPPASQRRLTARFRLQGSEADQH